MKRRRMYAVYKGDKFLFMGTLDELQEKMNVKRATLLGYATPAHKKRDTGNFTILVKLEDEND